MFRKGNEKLEEADKEIESWQNQLTVLRQRFKDTYPDVQSALLLLNAAQQKRENILKEESETKKGAPPATQPANPQAPKDARDLNASILQAQIEGKDLEIQEYTKQLKDANDHIKMYQSRLDIVPLGGRQYGELMRERELAKQSYEDLQNEVSKAEIAKEMEDLKQGEILEQLDPASLPATPTEPRRPLVISVGAGIGLLLGLVNRPRARKEGCISEESQGRSGFYEDDYPGQRSVARERSGGPAAALGMARMDDGLSCRGHRDLRVDLVLQHDERLTWRIEA